MVFLHIIDDYLLQGVLAEMKQRDWWRKQYPERMYNYDYVMALAMHSLSWSFMIMLPIAFAADFNVGLRFVFVFMVIRIFNASFAN